MKGLVALIKLLSQGQHTNYAEVKQFQTQEQGENCKLEQDMI